MKKKNDHPLTGEELERARIREDALRILDYGDNTASELARKLVKKGHDQGKVNDTVAVLISQNLVDDRRYAESYARVKSEAGKGPVWIRQKLSEKGVDSEVISDVLADYTERESERTACMKKALKICGLSGDFEVDESGCPVPAEDSRYLYEKAGVFEPDSEDGRGGWQEAYKYREKMKARLARRLASSGFSPSCVYYTVSKIADL